MNKTNQIVRAVMKEVAKNMVVPKWLKELKLREERNKKLKELGL